jgi:hypothetical protein
LFTLLAGPAAGAQRWRGLLVCAIDGTTMSVPDSPANLAVYGRQSGSHGGSGYPLLRLVTVVACGSRTVIDAVFGPFTIGEIRYAPRLFGCLRPGMLLLADRNFTSSVPSAGQSSTIHYPNARTRISPRVVKRAISKHRAKGNIDRTNHQAAITIRLTTNPEP